MSEPWYRQDFGDKDSRICIFTCANEAFAPITQLTLLNWRRYADRHGYHVRFYANGFYLDKMTTLSQYGDKIRFQFYEDLRGHKDIIMHLDADSLFINMGVKIEDLLLRLPIRFLWTYGDGGPMSGLWIARTDDTTEKHLRHAYERAAVENNARNGIVEPHGISDQDSMTRLMHIPPFSHTFGNCVDAERIGFCFPDTTNPNPWIVTARGGSIQEKLRALKEWDAKISTQSAEVS